MFVLKGILFLFFVTTQNEEKTLYVNSSFHFSKLQKKHKKYNGRRMNFKSLFDTKK